jgi:predicted Ser/Thr protein kinase
MTELAHIGLKPVESTVCPCCGRAFPAAGLAPLTAVHCPACNEPVRIQGRLGPFLITGILGEGGMGAVYRGTDTALERPVAVKVLQRQMAAGAEAIEGFRREAQAAARMNHGNIARIYAFGVEDDQPYIVMEFVNGKPLMDFIDRIGALETRFVLHVGIQAAEALNEAASHGLLHGDVKPENILTADDGHAKLIDFGLAALANRPGSAVIWGSPHYIPPERIIRGQRLDLRADLYSLGATLYHALTGHTPFTGNTPADVAKARLETVPPTPAVVRPEVDAETSALVMRMMSRSPDDRHADYRSLIHDMSGILERLGGFSTRGYLCNRLGDPAAYLKRSSHAVAAAGESRSRPARKAALLAAGVTGVLIAAGILTWRFAPSQTASDCVSDTNRTPMVVDVVPLQPTGGDATGAPPPGVVAPRAVPFFAGSDSATTTNGAEITIDVLANDGNPDSPAHGIVALDAPKHGKAKIADGGIVYAPDPGFEGTDSFRYTVKHAAGTATANVWVEVRSGGKPAGHKPPKPPKPEVAAVVPERPRPEHTPKPPKPPMPVKPPVLPPPPPAPAALEIRFDTTTMEHYTAADRKGMGAVVPMGDGQSVKFVGNALKAIPIAYTVRTNTVVEFTFTCTQAGDVHGVGLDTQTEELSPSRCFQVFGRRASPCSQVHNNYASFAPRPRRYTIPVGLTHTGAVTYLVFLNTGSGQPAPVSEFSDVKIYDFVRTPPSVKPPATGPKK